MKWTKIGNSYVANGPCGAAYTIRGPIGGKWVLYSGAAAVVSRHRSLAGAKRGAKRHWDVYGGIDGGPGGSIDRRKRGLNQ